MRQAVGEDVVDVRACIVLTFRKTQRLGVAGHWTRRSAAPLGTQRRDDGKGHQGDARRVHDGSPPCPAEAESGDACGHQGDDGEDAEQPGKLEAAAVEERRRGGAAHERRFGAVRVETSQSAPKDGGHQPVRKRQACELPQRGASEVLLVVVQKRKRCDQERVNRR